MLSRSCWTASYFRGRFIGKHFLPPIVAVLLAACSSFDPYRLVDQNLLANNPKRADAVIEQAEKEYGSRSRLLYQMDRGMTLHLAGEYVRSNVELEKADREVERLYTRSIRGETAAFLTNDTLLPYEGDPYEHVMINVIKALNYAGLGQLTEALVEARQIDHRLNVLSDRAKSKDSYRDDAFARYLSGVLYEASGDINNAFIAYRNAYEAYDAARAWSRVPPPSMLHADLLRTSEALHLNQEFEEYRRQFPGATWMSHDMQQQLAQVVVIGYNGRAPRKEDQFFDLPISLDALQLVLLNKGVIHYSNRQPNRAADSLLYGLNGRVVRVALPRLIPQKSQVSYEEVTVTGKAGAPYTAHSQLMQNTTALAEKALSERFAGLATKAVARAAVKFAAAEAATRGAQQAVNKDDAPWVGLAVALLTKGLAVASEESDKRSWRTLPDEIQIARLWVPAGDYDVRIKPVGAGMGGAVAEKTISIMLKEGETKFFIERVVR
ncbi:MAG: COG3014 family protein [Nitrospiraceae bacterium]